MTLLECNDNEIPIPTASDRVICPICFCQKPPRHEEFCEILLMLKEANQDLANLVQGLRSIVT